MSMSRISAVHGRQIFDSRGRPTVEVDVTLQNGVRGRAAVPSGASTGAAEALELRDGDMAAYGGLGVTKAAAHVNDEIARAVSGMDPEDQRGVDDRLRELDGTENLSRLGANAVLGVSLASCRAAAAAQGAPLWRRVMAISGNASPIMPMPMVNILSGGKHAGGGMDIQDFLMIPASARGFDEAMRMIAAVRTSATALCAQAGLPVLLADEGGLSPGLQTPREALDLMVQSFEAAGLEPGRDAVIALDMAAAGLATENGYNFERAGQHFSGAELVEEIAGWVSEYPIASIEDALGEEDWPHWRMLLARVSDIQLIGDDLLCTNPLRIAKAASEKAANAALIKVNQNGTLSGTLDAMAAARSAGFTSVVSARSGETEDDFIADLAVGTGAGQIKIGSVRCGERMAKYNQLVRIAEAVGDSNIAPWPPQKPVTT